MNFKENESPQKLRGGYYTPNNLASYLSRWVAEIRPARILEPSCGDGAFFLPLSEALTQPAKLTAVELNAAEAASATARSKCLKNLSVDLQCTDFLEWYLTHQKKINTFDAVLGNP